MRKIIIPAILIVIVVAGFFAFNTSMAKSVELSRVEMSVSRLSCGSCVETIRDAVTALDGSSKVATDVAAARSVVEFDAAKIDASQIADTITASGYPATVLFVRNPAGEILSGLDLDKYIARVGSRMILRSEFNQAFLDRLQAAETGGRPVPLRTLSRDAWSPLLSQELLLNAAGQFGITVTDADLEQRITDSGLAPGESREALHKSMLIDGFLTLQYPQKKPNGFEMAKILNALQLNTAVDIFDDNLKRYLSDKNGGSGCGGSCC